MGSIDDTSEIKNKAVDNRLEMDKKMRYLSFCFRIKYNNIFSIKLI